MHSALKVVWVLLFTAFTSGLFAQEDGTILLRNPSFEDMPRNSSPPRGWINCGFPGETPPDVQPDPQLEFRVTKRAQHGKTYLGMVTRENETYEAVGQQLSTPFKAGNCYEFNVQLARSEVYLSRSRRTNLPANYVTPVVLRIFGGYSICQRGQMIGQSEIVDSYTWANHRFKLEPDQDYTHIILEVYYQPQSMLPYNGNILVDNAQPLSVIPCDAALNPPSGAVEKAPLTTYVDPDEDIKTEPVVPRPATRPKPKPAPRPAAGAPAAPKVKLGATTGQIKEGQVFRIENISFQANSDVITTESEEALQEIVQFLRSNDNIIIEVGGHASVRASREFANKLSTQRARSVVRYLRDHSIPAERMYPRGYGKTRLLCNSNDANCHAKNQRVEVKILKLLSK